MNKRKSIILSLVAVIGLMVITIGVSYAFFNYAKAGAKENVLTTGTITFLYTEIDKVGAGIDIQDALPMTDSEGKAQIGSGKVFNFKIEANTTSNTKLPYVITARMKDTSTLPKESVKLYLTTVNGSESSTKITGTNGILYSKLKQYDKVTDHDERVIYQDTIKANSTNYLQEFNLRMWLDDSIDYSSGDYNGKSFTVNINVYSVATVYKQINSTMQSENINVNSKLWSHKSTITKIIIQDEIRPIPNTVYEYDMSETSNNSVMTRLIVDPEDSTKHIAYIQGDGGIYAPKSSRNLFNGFSVLKSIEGLQYLDTSKVIDMRYMFGGNTNLTDLDLSGFDTSNVTIMESMFNGNKSLVNVDISNFDTSNVTNMYGMFYECNSLTSLDVSSFDTSSVTGMGQMFKGCKKLTELDVSNFDNSKVNDMSNMFNGCSSLNNLNLTDFNTSNVTNIGGMFDSCSSLTSLDLSNFDTLNVTNTAGMFYGCSSLINLDLSNANFNKVDVKNNMFLNVPTTITVTVLDAAAETFIRSVLTGGTINIAG